MIVTGPKKLSTLQKPFDQIELIYFCLLAPFVSQSLFYIMTISNLNHFFAFNLLNLIFKK